MMSIGVTRCRTRFMGRRRERELACFAVRGKPSRINEELGSFDGSIAEEAEPLSADNVDMVFVSGVEVDNQFLEVSSLRINSRMSGSGTRDPEFMNDSACMPGTCQCDCPIQKHGTILPRGVLSLTLSLNKSPVLMVAN
jgi:hypothetical protein